MKLVKPPKIQVCSFWLSMPFIVLALMYIMYDERIWAEWKIWAVTFPLIYIIGFFSWYSHSQYDHFLKSRFPSLQLTGKRVLFKLLVNLFIMTPSVLLIFFVFHHFNILGYQIQDGDLKYGYLVGLAVNLVFETLWEVIYIIEKYKEATAEKDMLEQLQLQQEFDGLKQKVNPHFLFNCFNTLSALIAEDKDKAEKFLDELSKVYRYLLRKNNDSMNTLESEIKFIQSYFQLLKTRHGEAVDLQVEVDKQYGNYLLPSLSLQMLLENAVKHNALSKNKPLTIEIFTTTGNKLVVNNNLQRRTIKAPSNKVGLDNIKTKYELLHLKGFQVMEDGKNFTVVLPLIWNNTTENNKV
ncbi:sensor histidine kinase [Ferruginibacter sp. SUN106]|uniref:sensor histidine kinase n=1 Tax=Ferruginibacter sp. SUN106 TaxID=2978348 RepID=UPI003D35F44B